MGASIWQRFVQTLLWSCFLNNISSYTFKHKMLFSFVLFQAFYAAVFVAGSKAWNDTMCLIDENYMAFSSQ